MIVIDGDHQRNHVLPCLKLQSLATIASTTDRQKIWPKLIPVEHSRLSLRLADFEIPGTLASMRLVCAATGRTVDKAARGVRLRRTRLVRPQSASTTDRSAYYRAAWTGPLLVLFKLRVLELWQIDQASIHGLRDDRGRMPQQPLRREQPKGAGNIRSELLAEGVARLVVVDSL